MLLKICIDALCILRIAASHLQLKLYVMKSYLLVAAIAIIAALFSCNTNIGDQKPEIAQTQNIEIADFKEQEMANNMVDSSVTQEEEKEDKKKKTYQAKPSADAKVDWDKKIVKNANLSMEVKDYNVYNTSIRQKVRELGGYIAQEEQSQSDYKIENTVTIKVPVEQFDAAVAVFSSDVIRVNEKRVTSQDVTAEYVDTRSRMEAKKHVRQRYIDLLRQAKNMEEILNVQQQVNGIQEEIESAAGRIQYLGHASTFSTIQLTYFQVLNISAKDTAQPTFGEQLSHAFKMGGNWFANLLIGLVSIWPLLFLGLLAVLLFRRYSSRKAPLQNGGVTGSGQ